jgi:hypothetical protein
MTTSSDEAASSPTDETPAAPAATANPDPAPPPGDETADLTLAGEAMNLLSEHKGKLAIGVAATLGMMVYYGWREKRLAKTDPEEYARLQRLKAKVRHSDDQPRPRSTRKSADATQAGHAAAPAAADKPDQADATPDIS